MSTTTVEQPIKGEAAFVPVGHFLHPHDPTGRTALCGVEILGVPTFGKFETCVQCQVLCAAQDWAPLPR